VSEKLLILPPFEESTSGKEEFVEPESFYTPYPKSRYKSEENLEFIEGVEYIPLEKIPILEETSRRETQY
jgi:hypothetical protein